MVEHIAEKKPDVLLVGMGTPLQELWVDHYFDQLDARVVWTVGALFDYVSGRVPRAPHWMADHGLEWIFRLAIEPRRMWRRYLLGNPMFLLRVMNARHEHRDEQPWRYRPSCSRQRLLKRSRPTTGTAFARRDGRRRRPAPSHSPAGARWGAWAAAIGAGALAALWVANDAGVAGASALPLVLRSGLAAVAVFLVADTRRLCC